MSGLKSVQQVTTKAMDFRVNGVPTSGEPSVTFYRFEEVRDYLPHDRSGGVFRLCEQYPAMLRDLLSEWSARRADLGPQ